MKYIVLSVLLAAAVALPADLDSSWASYYRGFNYWFAYQGPERAMRLHPADFGLTCPVRVESLKTLFYGSMGSLDDTVFAFKIYSGDGQTLLWQSDSLTLHPGNGLWFTQPVAPPVVVDSGDLYIATSHRLLDPWAHPYVRQDSGVSSHSFFGSPGSWEPWEDGEYAFLAWLCEGRTGVSEGRWTIPAQARPASIAGLMLVSDCAGRLLDQSGRSVRRLSAGNNSLAGIRSGVYFVVTGADRPPRKVLVP